MGYPRAHLIDEDNPGFYHLISECVRRAFLCGVDEKTGCDYSHRQRWIEARAIELTHYFAIDLYAYAVMSNHYHLVILTDPDRIQPWSDEEVARRWVLANHNPDKPALAAADLDKKVGAEIDKGPARVETLRARLKSVSWFMARINEVLARRSNKEDGCRGRFWEGRFHSESLLDEHNVLRAMVYADLNPVRAGITRQLEQSTCNGARRRLEQVKAEPECLDSVIRGFSAQIESTQAQAPPLMLTTREYVELVRWTGENVVYPDKAALAPLPPGDYFEQLGIVPSDWLDEVNAFSKRRRARGPLSMVREYMRRLRLRFRATPPGSASSPAH